MHAIFFHWQTVQCNPEFRKKYIALDAIKKSLMFAMEIKKSKSYPQTIFGTHLPVMLDLENVQVKMYNHEMNSLLSKFSKRHRSDHHSSLHRKENKPEEDRTTVAHIRQLSSFVHSDVLVYCYLFIMLFSSIRSDSRLCSQFLLHCNIEMQYKKIFYKYLHSKDSHLGSIYTKGNINIPFTQKEIFPHKASISFPHF